MIRPKFLLLLLVVQGSLSLFSQKQTLVGFSAGWQSNHIFVPQSDFPEGISGAWRVAAIVDFPVTSRLSLQGQAGMQYITNRKLNGAIQQVVYPEIWMGLQEYLPAGGGAFFVNASVAAGLGFGNSEINGAETAIFDQDSYNKWRMSWVFLAGYVFRNGLTIHSGAQGSFNRYYTSPSLGSGYKDFSLHALSIGYLFGYKKRLVLPQRKNQN